MSSTYSRNSWPYKNIVISFFQQFLECSQGAEVEDERRGMVGHCVSTRGRADQGWIEEGKPHSDRLSLSVPAATTVSHP